MAKRRENILSYKPKFKPEKWNKKDYFYLKPFFTNPDGLVCAVNNLPPELIGALSSRASRAQNSLLKIFISEYVYPILSGSDKKLAKKLHSVIKSFNRDNFRNVLNNARAQKFFARWLSQFGDDSIAQMTGLHLFFWGISQVAMKHIEEQRLGLEPLEKSTRYVNFSKKVNGKYLYYTPEPDLKRFGLLADYRAVLDNLFKTYTKLLSSLILWFKKNYSEKDSVIEKKAFDTLRGLLPCATLGQLALRGNAQAFEYLINRSAKHPLGEMRYLAHEIKQELSKEIPSLLLRVDDEKSQRYQEYLIKKRENVYSIIKNDKIFFEARNEKPGVKLCEFDNDGENKIIASMLFSESKISVGKILSEVKKMKKEEKEKIVKAYLGGRGARWQKVGRALENSYLKFEVICNIGAFRDIQRHRTLTIDRQFFTTDLGYEMPKEIIAAGLNRGYALACQKTEKLFKKIEKKDRYLAQYAVPMIYNLRFYQLENLREFFWEVELRTGPQGHPDYRFIEQEKYKLIKNKFPILSKYILVDLKNYEFARRESEEKIVKKEKYILEKLKK